MGRLCRSCLAARPRLIGGSLRRLTGEGGMISQRASESGSHQRPARVTIEMGTRRNGTTLATQEFGALERDPQREAYIGTLEWCGTQVQLALACADNVDPQHALSVAVGLSQKQPDWDSRIREFAADELLIL